MKVVCILLLFVAITMADDNANNDKKIQELINKIMNEKIKDFSIDAGTTVSSIQISSVTIGNMEKHSDELKLTDFHINLIGRVNKFFVESKITLNTIATFFTQKLDNKGSQTSCTADLSKPTVSFTNKMFQWGYNRHMSSKASIEKLKNVLVKKLCQIVKEARKQ